MNTPVDFELSKLLKEKRFDLPTLQWYHRYTKKLNTNDFMFSMNKLTDNYSVPTIVEVVMWLYEKHKIWIYAHKDGGWWFPVIENYYDEEDRGTIIEDLSKMKRCYFSSPKEAYEAAIKYCLTELI